MALARARRSESGFNYWPGFVDALSTLVLSIVFLLSVFLVVQFFLSQEVTGKDKALEQLNAKIAQLNDLLSLEKLGKLDARRPARRKCAPASPPPKASATASRASTTAWPAPAATPQGRANELNKALDSEKPVTVARAGADRGAEPADQRAAPPARGARRSARRLREARQGIAGAHRRSRPAPERRAGAARAGTVALPLGILRPAARHSRQSSRHPHRRRPLRVPVGSVLRHRPGRAAARRPRRARQARHRADRSRQADPERNRLGAAGRRPHRRAADQHRRCSSRTGNCRRRAPSRWCNTWSRSASPRSGWSPPVLPNSSRSTPRRPKTPTSATAASN